MEGGSLIKCVFDVNKLISERPAKLSYFAALSPTSKGKLSSSPELVTISNPLIRQKKVTCNGAVFNFFYVYGQVYICKINFKLIEMHIYRIILYIYIIPIHITFRYSFSSAVHRFFTLLRIGRR